MSVILQLKGQLAELKQQQIALSLGGHDKVSAAKDVLALSGITSFAEIDLERAIRLLTDARQEQQQMAEVVRQIGLIRKELGE